ncbi:MAG: hypothetical protein ABH881_00385 [bacterium]
MKKLIPRKKIFFLLFILFFMFVGLSALSYNTEKAVARSLWDSQEGLGAGDRKIASVFGENESGARDIREVVIIIIKYALSCLALILVAYILYGGYTYMTSMGNKDKVDEAKKIIFRGVIGALIVMSSYSIVVYVTQCALKITNEGFTNIGGSDYNPGTSPWYCKE